MCDLLAFLEITFFERPPLEDVGVNNRREFPRENGQCWIIVLVGSPLLFTF